MKDNSGDDDYSFNKKGNTNPFSGITPNKSIEKTETQKNKGEVSVVGTAHVSEESVEKVKKEISERNPDIVAVELDEARYKQFKGETPDNLEPGDLLKGNTVFHFIAYWVVSYLQKRLGNRFDVKPGSDMMAAIETAENLDIDIALVDRDIQETIRRFWKNMTLLEKFKLLGGLVFGIKNNYIAGLIFGLFVGLVIGPFLGFFGGSVGITYTLLTKITAGVIFGVFTGYISYILFDKLLIDNLKTLFSVIISVLVILLFGVFLSIGSNFVDSYLSGFLIRVIGGITIGTFLGIFLGLLSILILNIITRKYDTYTDIEELDISEITDKDVVTMMVEEFRKFSPGGAKALIDERDAYIAHNLNALKNQRYDIVAVVGAGHKKGIEKYLENPDSLPPIGTLVENKSKKWFPWKKFIGILLSVIFIAFFILLAMAGVRDIFLLKIFGLWFLINGLFALTLAKIAGARWISAIVGGLVAWMTSINPMLAPGWFTGYIELRYIDVNISDISKLNELLEDETKDIRQLLSEMFDIPLFKLIMIVALTNLGSMIASILFVLYILPYFGAELGGMEGVSNLIIHGAQNSAELIWEYL